MSYWYKPEMWRDEDVREEDWEDFIRGVKEMNKSKGAPKCPRCGHHDGEHECHI